MAELVALLGTISVLLTFTAAYRLSGFALGGGPGLGALIALGAAVGYIVLFEYVILFTGIGVLTLPFVALYRWRNTALGINPLASSITSRIGGAMSTSGVECDNCGATNTNSNEYCGKCGGKL